MCTARVHGRRPSVDSEGPIGAKPPELRGFTLVELLLVITLLAVLSAVAVPKLSGTLRRTGLQEGAGDLAAVIRLGRQEAVRRGLSVRLTVDRKESSYELELQDPVHNYEETYVDFEDSLLDARHYLPEGIRFVQEDDTPQATREYVFPASGIGDPQTIEVADAAGQRIRLELGAWYEDLRVTRAGRTPGDAYAAP